MCMNNAQKTREASLGWKIQRIAGALNRSMTSQLSAVNLGLDQFAVMMTVLEIDGLTQTEIGTRIGVQPHGISRAIDRLQDRG